MNINERKNKMKPTQTAENIKNKNIIPEKRKPKNKKQNRNGVKNKNQTWSISFTHSKILLDVPVWVRIVRVFKKRFRS